MEETFDELVTKHTRRDLEEMALKYGVENFSGTKSQLADAILEAMKSQKNLTGSTLQEVKPPVQEKPKEVPMAEKPKTMAVEQTISPKKRGVMAKISAINRKSNEMSRGVKEFQTATDKMSRETQAYLRTMLEDGRQRFNAGQAEFKQALEFQKKENKESAAKLNSGAGEIRSSADKMSRDFQKAAEDLRDRVNQFKSSVDAQIKENQSAISRIGSGARELQEKATSFQNEIHRYQEQDLKNSVRDFYYG
jgi:hypothetical protein